MTHHFLFLSTKNLHVSVMQLYFYLNIFLYNLNCQFDSKQNDNNRGRISTAVNDVKRQYISPLSTVPH